MYETYFGLKTEPFSVAPDPRFMYLSDPHREALRHLEIGLRGGAGFVLLTGEIGAGKTTVWRSFLEQLPTNFDVATVVNPKLDVDALLARVCDDLGVELTAGPGRDPIDALHGHLLLAHAQGRRTLIAVDEAQALSDAVFEQLRLLTNLVTSERKFVQVLLIGQPELLDRLEQPALEPLAQRVVARYHLGALPAAETRRYIAHRLAVAGGGGAIPFDEPALGHIHELCGGVPRRINVLCDRALLVAWERRVPRVTAPMVDQAAKAVFARPVRAKPAGGAAPSPAAAPVEPAHDRRAWPYIAGAALVAGLVLSPWVRGWFTGPAPVADVSETKAPAPPPAAVQPAPAQASPAPPPAAAATSEDRLAGPGDEAAAWRELVAAWGITLPAGEPCTMAAAQGLPCWRGRGGLAAVRQLDRPVLLTLTDAQAPVLLTGLSDQVALLRIGGQERRVPLATLLRDWRGEFTTVWRAPPGWREGLVVSEQDSTLARWVGERLARIDNRAGQPLPERITAFQLAQGLAPDGIAGPQTLLALNRAAGVEEPRLARP
jgi:general secretion pathway protein A